MSARLLKKLQQLEVSSPDASDSELLEEEEVTQPKANLFALLGAETDEEDEKDEDEDEDQQQEESKKGKEIKVINKEIEDHNPPSKSKSKKNKKKNKKKKKKSNSHKQLESEDISNDYPINPEFPLFKRSNFEASSSLLTINRNDLNPENEYKQLFGKTKLSTGSEVSRSSFFGLSSKQWDELISAYTKQGWGGRSIPHTSRKLLLSSLPTFWVPVKKKPLNMEKIPNSTPSSENVSYFKFKKNTLNSDEEKQQFKYNAAFFHAIQSGDHQRIFDILKQNPVHIESLLQGSEILLKQGGLRDESNIFLERAMVVFDWCFNKTFDILSGGKSRLPFKYFLNRQFHLCLFKYILSLTQRGTYFTALQFVKLLWSLNPEEDPYGVRYFIDHYCIISGEYEYLIDLSKSDLITTYTDWYTPGIAYNLVLAYLYLNKTEEAKESLIRAMSLYPWTAHKLLMTLGIFHNNNENFNFKFGNYDFATKDIEVMTESIIIRSKQVWVKKEHLDFLRNESEMIISSELWKSSTDLLYEDIKKLAIESELDKDKEAAIFPINLGRFALLSGEGKIMSHLPSKVWEIPNFTAEYDVMAPLNDEGERFPDDWVNLNDMEDEAENVEYERQLMEQIARSLEEQ